MNHRLPSRSHFRCAMVLSISTAFAHTSPLGVGDTGELFTLRLIMVPCLSDCVLDIWDARRMMVTNVVRKCWAGRRRFLPYPLASGCPEAGLSTVQGPETSPPTNPTAVYHDGFSNRFEPVRGLVPVGSDPRGGGLSDLMLRIGPAPSVMPFATHSSRGHGKRQETRWPLRWIGP